MNSDRQRWLQITAALARRDAGQGFLSSLCSTAAATLSVAAAGITVMGGGDVAASMGASDPAAARLEELEFTLGQGPGGDAYAQGLPILEADLAGHPPQRWAAFAGGAVDAGIRAVFSFPLRVGAARLGALTLYHDHPGTLGDERYGDALVLADAITSTVMALHAGMPEELVTATLGDEGAYRAEVHQATGMISVQLDIPVGDALARLRARAFALDRPIAAVAVDVVARRVRFDE